jgi:4-amino-4-deoxy-L-arabinose transferase-like glycosyltransferase
LFSRSNLFIIILIGLAAFTHLWNPIGFPYPEFDEGIYMGRGLYLLTYQDFDDPIFINDHPYFGNLFMAGLFKLANFVEPNLLNTSEYGYENSIIQLFLSSRLAMGLLAIIDTILIYKIVERVYKNKTYGFFAAVLFAVMPATWLSRWIHLDTIQLPFVLASILLALWARSNEQDNQKLWLVCLSGIFLGISIFTKVPVFTMIPLIGYLVYSQRKSIRNLSIWFLPVILIPLIWPIYSIHQGEFREWAYGIIEQTHRGGWPLYLALEDLLKIDPVLLIIGIIASAYALIKRDVFLILFTYPYLIFLFFINFVSNFHLLLLVVSFCIAISKFILDLLNKNPRIGVFRWPIISIFTIFGLASSFMLISNGDNSAHFDALRYVYESVRQNDTRATSIVASPFYVFLPIYTAQLKNYSLWTDDQFTSPEIIQVLDPEFKKALKYPQEVTSSTYHRMYEEFPIEKLRNFTNFKNDTVGVISLKLTDKKLDNIEDRKIINLTDGKLWKADKNVKILSSNKNLTMYVDTSELAKAKNRMILDTIINTTDIPSLLSLDYSLKTLSPSVKLSVEIRDENDLILWSKNLGYTSGNNTYYLFILPENINMKPVRLIFNLESNGPGKHQLIIRDGIIF